MNKITNGIFIFLAMLLISATPVFASLDTIDASIKGGMEVVQEKVNEAKNEVSQVKTKINKAISKAREKYEMVKKSIKEKISNMIPQDEDEAAKPIASMKTLKESQLLSDQTDPKAVSDVVQQLFMAYPSQDPAVMSAYRLKADEFWSDTVMELYLVSRSFDQQIEEIEKAIDELSEPKNLSGAADSGGGDDDSDDIQAYVSAYMAYVTFDDLVRLVQTFGALRSQYRAARFIRYNVKPAPYKGDKKADLPTISSKNVYAKSEKQFNLSFAAVSKAKIEPFGGYTYDVKANSKVKYEKSADPDLKSSFSGSEKEFEMLGQISEAQEVLREAINVHNIRQGLPSHKHIFDTYHKIVNQHVDAIAKVQQSDMCVVNFLSNYYKNPESVWYGAGKSKNPVDYEARKGISGLLYKAYQAGKVLLADSDEYDENAFAPVEYENNDDNATSDIGATSAKAEKFFSDKYEEKKDAAEGTEDEDDDNDTGVIPGLSSQTDAVKIKQNVRNREKFNFLFGAELMRALAADQYGSYKWGKPYRKFQIWNDQKNFYDTYLNKKYKNMTDYINELSYLDFLIDMVNIAGKNYKNDGEEVKKQVVSNLQKIYNTYQANKANIIKELDSKNKFKQLVEERKTVLKSMENNYESKKKSIENTIDGYRTQLDNLFAKIEAKQDQIDELEKTLQEAKAGEKQAKNEEKIASERMAKSKVKESGFLIRALAVKTDNAKLQIQTKNSLKQAKSELKVLKISQEVLEKNIMNKKKELARLSVGFEDQYLDREKFYEHEINNLRNSNADAKIYTVTEVKNKYVGDAGNVIVRAEVDKILNTIDGDLLRCVKEYAKKQVDNAKQEIDNLGDVKYSAEGAKQIADIHKNMVKKLQPSEYALSQFDMCKTDALTAYPFMKYVEALFSGAFHNKICEKDSCLNEDGEYFVGVAPVERDFKQAHHMSDGILPPVREVVYFDNEDYTALPKNNRLYNFRVYKKTSRKEASKILAPLVNESKGEYVPEIWRKMLDPHSYVEVGYDLSKLSNDADVSAKNYVRGGVYPCKLAMGLYADLATDEGNKIVYQFSSSAPKTPYAINLPECQEIGVIEVKKPREWTLGFSLMKNYHFKVKKTGKAYWMYDKVYNKAEFSRRDGIDVVEDGFAAQTSRPSELASLVNMIDKSQTNSTLGAVLNAVEPDKMFVVAQTPVNIFKRLKKDEEKDEGGKTSFYMAAAYRTQMNRNQFGDFLTMVENEQALAKTESQLREEINSLRESLIANLKTAGIEVSPDIDLSDENQYLSLTSKLISAKNRLLADMSNKLIKLTLGNDKENELLDEKMKKLNAARSALIKDADTMVVISESSDGNSSEFAQSIKEATVNSKATEKYEEDVEDNTKNSIVPYCASYPIY